MHFYSGLTSLRFIYLMIFFKLVYHSFYWYLYIFLKKWDIHLCCVCYFLGVPIYTRVSFLNSTTLFISNHQVFIILSIRLWHGGHIKILMFWSMSVLLSVWSHTFTEIIQAFLSMLNISHSTIQYLMEA